MALPGGHLLATRNQKHGAPCPAAGAADTSKQGPPSAPAEAGGTTVPSPAAPLPSAGSGALNNDPLRKMDVSIRGSVRRWLDLPHDTPLGFFHAPVAEGGLGITSLRASIPSMLLQRLANLSLSGHPGCEAAIRTPLLTGLLRRANAATSYQGRLLTSKMEVHRMWAMLLHRSCDGKALKESRRVPAAHRWLTDGTHFLSGREFINLVKPKINELPTLERTSRGRDRDIN